MKMNELKLIYFSPTGTTHKVVMETARSIDLKSVSFDLTIKKDLKPVAKFAPNDFALFAIPVYYGRVRRSFSNILISFPETEHLPLLSLHTDAANTRMHF